LCRREKSQKKASTTTRKKATPNNNDNDYIKNGVGQVYKKDIYKPEV